MSTPDPQFQNRIVVLGRGYDDARLHARMHPALKDVEIPVLVSSESHRYTILGSIAGMHVATAYVTPAAHRGPQYEVALEAVKRCLARSGGELLNLTEGSTYASI